MKGMGALRVAETLDVSVRSVRDARWRLRVGLPARRIGRRLIFAEDDVQRLLRRNVERFAHGKREEGYPEQPAHP